MKVVFFYPISWHVQAVKQKAGFLSRGGDELDRASNSLPVDKTVRDELMKYARDQCLIGDAFFQGSLLQTFENCL